MPSPRRLGFLMIHWLGPGALSVLSPVSDRGKTLSLYLTWPCMCDAGCSPVKGVGAAPSARPTSPVAG